MAQISRRMNMREVVETLVLSGANLSEDTDETGYDRQMYLRTLFGYIALVGTSKKAVHYGEVQIMGPRTNKVRGVDARGVINIAEQVNRMRGLSVAVTEGVAKDATVRQMCEPFAKEAYEALIMLAGLGVYSQLAIKMSRLGNKEPQVMFDFAAGLDVGSLSRQEATVMQAMHARLFRTEHAKEVFDAQASVGEQAAEI
uniref:CP n=1 Tax=Grapevine virus F TaxID=1221437 RepID=A0A5J7JXR2_9VIRU|nr:CP [Grapevine virus F]